MDTKCGRCRVGKVEDKPHFSQPGGSACVELSFADHRATLVQFLCEECTGELAQFMQMAWCGDCNAWVRNTHLHSGPSGACHAKEDVGSTEKSVGRGRGGGAGTPGTGGAIGRGGGGGAGGVGSR